MVRVSEPYDNSGSSDYWYRTQRIGDLGEMAVLSLSELKSFLLQVIRPVPSHGALGEPSLVFLEYEVAELTALAKVLLGTYPFTAAACVKCKSKLIQEK